MDKQKILIMNLSKGRIGEDNSALIGAMMITKIQLAAMGRVDIEEEERKDFYLYVDEFQNFATESFANILSEARKYRLNLILANQYIMQIDEKVRDAIFGNAGTLIAFRVGAGDAEALEKEFEPIFMMNDIVNLPKFNIYLKLMIDGIAGNAFSAATLAPFDIGPTKENEEKVIKVSRERYSASAEEVEDKIKRWSGMLVEEKAKEAVRVIETRKETYQPEKIVVVPKIVIPKKEIPVEMPVKEKMIETAKEEEEKKMYEATCDTCGEKIQVPFKPDKQRPTFCKDCFKDYQRAMARAKVQQKEELPEEPRRIVRKAPEREKTVKDFERKTFVSEERPMTLSQLKYVAPKKFKPAHKKSAVNLEELRKLINKSKNE